MKGQFILVLLAVIIRITIVAAGCSSAPPEPTETPFRLFIRANRL